MLDLVVDFDFLRANGAELGQRENAPRSPPPPSSRAPDEVADILERVRSAD